MRWKIITVNSVVIILLGVFLAALMGAQLKDIVANESRIVADASRAVSAANAQLQLDALQVERWLAAEATNAAAREPFEASDPRARNESATKQCNRIRDAATQAPTLTGLRPAVVAMVDTHGVALGRDGNNLMRGDDLGKAHPRMKDAISKGLTGSSIWYLPKLSQQWFVSYAAVRNAQGEVLGGLIYGAPLNDERLTHTRNRASGSAIVIALETDRGVEPVAKSDDVPRDVADAIKQPPVADNVKAALKLEAANRIDGAPKGWVLVAQPLDGYGGTQGVILGVAPASLMDVSGLMYSIVGMVFLGIILVSISGWLLGSYISKPIEEIEEGLLQILNGRTDLRFEIEHAVLGGLVFRINTLLNQLMGVQEDDTDEDGRPSLAPSATAFQGALEVDEHQATQTEQVDVETARRLAQEPAESYYARIFQEYIRAKSSIGDPVDHITEASFVERIRLREQETSSKSGRPVRYQVQLRGREVILIAVQLP